MRNNKKAFTLMELVIYTSVFMLASVIIISLFTNSLIQNQKSTMNIEFLKNVSGSEKYLRKASENINGILLIRHEDVNTVTDTSFGDINISNAGYNGHTFSLAEIRDTCDFIIDDNFDIVALKTVDGLDPVVIGVIEKETESGRTYRQLAIYKYYSTYTQGEKIEQDYEDGNITPFITDEGQYQTGGLTVYKCNTNNGFLIPISSKNYIDAILDYDYTVYLESFKVLPYGLSSSAEGLKTGLIEYELGWVVREKNLGRIIYQTISKVFTYE